MAGKRKYGNAAVPVSDVASDIIDPVLRKRAGITIGLVQSWEEIVGERLAASTRPEKIAWPRRLNEDDPFEPAALVIACEGAAALRLQHETGEIIERVNAFLGFGAIGRVKIVQKPVAPAPKRRPVPRRLTGAETAHLDKLVDGIENDGLREALARLGRSILGEKR
ncbi:DUF721 domain-containing protein [Mesorhizobium microcysteis]|jgi:hypothetical protein|uniref:DUF721 domain-containing protein n=1 Tax=Neoaquamicrobium microcysteis TaxID=2682781 RepID=A0A5D4GVQ6_9HYPH|nr:DUF721 domain-containing protein [Mesorhizobium microcysteis]TYR31859.1 DUF721 domain-containing protein [Mesorhizobium microcysteis]